MQHTMPGIMWALVRQQIQVEAIISALAIQQPSLPEQSNTTWHHLVQRLLL